MPVPPEVPNCGRAGLVSRLESAVLLAVLHVLLPAGVVDRPEEPSFLLGPPPWPSCCRWWLCWNRMERMRLCVAALAELWGSMMAE